MADSLRRVSILHDDNQNNWPAVDLALPAGPDVDALLPAIVDLVCPDTARHPYRYGLSFLGGEELDGARSLSENAVRDGDVLVLSTAPPGAPAPVADDAARALASAADDDVIPDGAARVASFLWASALAVGSLAWSARSLGHATPMIVTAALTVLTGIAGVAAHRGARPRVGHPLQAAGAALAGLTGYLVVPGPPGTAGVFLGSVAVVAAAVVQLRMSRCDTTWSTALAAAMAVVAVGSGSATVWALPAAAAGVLVTTLSLAGLGLAPRIVLSLSGLRPAVPDADDGAASGEVDLSATDRCHQRLSGAILGLALSATLGALTLMVGCLSGAPPWPAAAFTGAAGIALALRARSHVGALRRRALGCAGTICLTMCFVVIADAAPWATPWAAVAALAVAASGLHPPADSVGPAWHKAVDVAEYASLAALPPLACWVTDIYGFVRGLSL